MREPPMLSRSRASKRIPSSDKLRVNSASSAATYGLRSRVESFILSPFGGGELNYVQSNAILPFVKTLSHIVDGDLCHIWIPLTT